VIVNLPLAPFQLIAQHMKKIGASAEEVDLMFRAAAANAVAVPQIEAGLSVQA
jgi:hypothetical protein